ncbi:hypothetical protein RND71_030430 [Anisodus tanguticus]|uniref:DEK-C domain-containing protein n=1 Tax=Anisodus tanguticus TaxID=243964 RepID=A0AAE1RHQ7_9SOLA|nr:hypothetical protein RND71_030430 [Anisodus tanguticus]
MASEKETLEDKKPDEEQQGQEEEKNTAEVEEVDEKDAEEEKPIKKKESEEEPKTPISRPTRERKTVERYSESSDARGSTPKPLSIRKVSDLVAQLIDYMNFHNVVQCCNPHFGSGTQLKDIPNVAYKLSKRKPDDNLQILHNILYGKKSKVHSLKKNIGQFSGFVWVENEEKQRGKTKEKLDKCVKEKLLDFCDVLNIPVSRSAAKKDELSVKLLEFLESPHPTTDSLLADKEQGKKQKRKGTASKSAGSSDNTTGKSVKQKHQKFEAGVKRKWSSKTEEEEADDQQPSDSGDDSENDDEAPKEGSDQEESGSEKDEKQEEDEVEEKPKKNKSNEKISSKKSAKKDSGSKTAEKSKAIEKGSPAKSSKSSSKSTPSSLASKKGASAADSTSKTKKEKAEKKSKKEETEPVKENSSGKKQSSKSTSKISEKGKGKSVKKAKAEPSNEELHEVVANILKEVDFNTATLSDIIRRLGSHFDVDLMHRKAEVKAIITEVINNMSDEEEEDEPEGDDDAEKPEGDDSDA